MIWLLIGTLVLFSISSSAWMFRRSGIVRSSHFFLLYWCPLTWKAMTFLVDILSIGEQHRDRKFFLSFIKGLSIVGKSIDLVDDLNIMIIVCDCWLEWEHVIFRIFVEEGEDRKNSIHIRTMRVNLLNVSEVWVGSWYQGLSCYVSYYQRSSWYFLRIAFIRRYY